MTIQDIINSTRSATAINELGKYKGAVNLNANQTSYVANIQQGVDKGGVISISQAEVSKTARVYGISTEVAQMEIAIHELGHERYASSDALAFSSTAAGREAWCYRREGEASYFGFTVALEAQANGLQLGVIGPGIQPNLFASMLNFSKTLTGSPQSLVYQNAMIDFAKNTWANDPQYQKYCKAWANSQDQTKPPLFLAPEVPRDAPNDSGNVGVGGGGGGGGVASGGGGGHAGGGFWLVPIEENPETIPIGTLQTAGANNIPQTIHPDIIIIGQSSHVEVLHY